MAGAHSLLSLPPAFETLLDSLPETGAENFRENLPGPPGILIAFNAITFTLRALLTL